MISVGRSAWCTIALETLPRRIGRRPVSPRDPMAMMAASWRSAISTIVLHTGPLASTASGLALRRLLREANAVAGDALAEVRGGAIDFDEAEPAVGRAGGCEAAQCGRRFPDGHDQRIATAQNAARVLDHLLGILGSLVA